MSDCASVSGRPAHEQAAASGERLPVANLLALATAGFITILTEALPAGLLPLMSGDLRVTEALVGQLVTVYALGSIVAAIPLVAATRGMRRRRLLLAALGGFVASNALTAASPYYALTLVARFVAGMSAGLLWALLAGYASRMAGERLRGRAIAVAMLGAPVAMSIGIPAGTALGSLFGWRVAFGGITLAALALFALAALMLGASGAHPLVYAAVALWGLAFGGAATLFQTALAHAAGEAADVAQSMLVTVWNLAIAGGGVVGGLLLDGPGAGAMPWVLVALLMAAWIGAWRARRHGFPAARPA
ncbi:MFS transporter [Burkholderia ubonensis]|uniref:MFS transporter n=1 Tax=Burkholderia ubonensis TaxID=101571 RepID=UPI000753BF1E|nr:MFS transporter [Burkholderia ubonensis]KVL06332.1 hypothetical protein WJ45_09780 [Burkholderia ubonensis]KVQ47902.1 hypothetical protein WK04_10120 [Burkholderia ubonensis]